VSAAEDLPPAPGLRARLEAALAAPGRLSSDYDLNPAPVLPARRRLRDAAVLVALVEGAQGTDLLLTKRSSRLKHHPGQVAFPGGKVDAGDADATAAALREAREEVGLDPAGVDVLGTLAPHETVTGFSVTPVLALARPFTPVAEAGEVAEVFTVPFAHVADPANFTVERRRWRGTWRRYYAIPLGPYYIWGATARMLRALADRLPPA
jgi:8-oxo-dGTP pyrophosphatase MutT (NUDIX family)